MTDGPGAHNIEIGSGWFGMAALWTAGAAPPSWCCRHGPVQEADLNAARFATSYLYVTCNNASFVYADVLCGFIGAKCRNATAWDWTEHKPLRSRKRAKRHFKRL